MLLFVLIVVALGSVVLAAWVLDRTRPTDAECDCTRCVEKRRGVDKEWSA